MHSCILSFYFLSAIKTSGCSSQLSQKDTNSLISKIHSRVSDLHNRKACLSMSEGITVELGNNNRSMSCQVDVRCSSWGLNPQLLPNHSALAAWQWMKIWTEVWGDSPHSGQAGSKSGLNLKMASFVGIIPEAITKETLNTTIQPYGIYHNERQSTQLTRYWSWNQPRWSFFNLLISSSV